MVVQSIVLIHGWASDESIWEKTKHFLEKRYRDRVYTLNLPVAKNMYSYRDAVVELIALKGLAQVIVVGWSMGALVAIQVAHQLPHRVQGLVLVSGTSRFLTDSQPEISVLGCQNTLNNGGCKHHGVTLAEIYSGGISAALIVRMKKRISKSYPQTITEFYKLLFSPSELAQGLAGEVITGDLARGRTWNLIEAQAGLDFLAEADVRDELEGITCPTLLLHGELDQICPLEGALYIQQQIPCAQLVSYPGVGHIPFSTNFEGFHKELERWLASYDDK